MTFTNTKTITISSKAAYFMQAMLAGAETITDAIMGLKAEGIHVHDIIPNVNEVIATVEGKPITRGEQIIQRGGMEGRLEEDVVLSDTEDTWLLVGLDKEPEYDSRFLRVYVKL